jgi:hypothetical protein
MITHNPLHGSGRADFPHPALAFGNNAHAAQGIGMTDSRQRQPASDEAPHTSPEHATVLAAPRQRAMPEPPRLESKKSQRRSVHGHSVISEVSTHHRLQPFALFGNGLVHPSLKLGFHLVQLRLQPFADRLPQHRVHSVAPLRHEDMREAEEVEVSHEQRFQVMDVVQECCEPQLLILLCCLTYPLQRTGRVVPARCPGRVLLWQVPFGQPLSLHPLRDRLSVVVRGLPRYCRAVRLPRSVRHRRASLDFPMRPKATGALGGRGISRFPSEVPAYVHGVSDRAGLWHTSRYRCTRWSLPLSPTASASRRKFLTRLNTRPARSPYASTPPSRTAPHDSGPMRVAKPLSCDFFIHYNLAGLTGAQESNHGCEHG